MCIIDHHPLYRKSKNRNIGRNKHWRKTWKGQNKFCGTVLLKLTSINGTIAIFVVVHDDVVKVDGAEPSVGLEFLQIVALHVEQSREVLGRRGLTFLTGGQYVTKSSLTTSRLRSGSKPSGIPFL